MNHNNSASHPSTDRTAAGSRMADSAVSLQDAHGPVPYSMTNDYMFRAVLQSNARALKGLICALLHLPESEVISIEVPNPIILGVSLADKECRLDINVLLNNCTRINLEMKVANRLNWLEQSIIYLCRTFSQLEHGQDYAGVKPVIYIGFLDYTLFENYPKFYATFQLAEKEDGKLYSDKFSLGVVNLTKIDSATCKDKKFHIHYWAELFKAATWEEIKMLASKDEYLNAAANSIFQYNTDEQIRKMCMDREEYYQDIRNYDRVLEEANKLLTKKDLLIKKSIAENQKLLTEIEQLKKRLRE